MSFQLALSSPNHPSFDLFSLGEYSKQIAEARGKFLAPFLNTKANRFKKNRLSLEEQLYDAKAFCKIETSKVSMYFSNEWREGFFAQLDDLMDIDNWEEDDKPVTNESFSTLLRMLTLITPIRRPGIGATSDGNIIAAWTNGTARLTIECQSNDRVRWVLSHIVDDIRESAAGETQLPRLEKVLYPYNPNRWFFE
jgi:hypothetical protein